MRTKLSTKGQVVLPRLIRNRLGLRAGDELDADVENGRIVLSPHRKRLKKGRIQTDPVTGMAVLTAGPGAAKLTSKEVDEILASFP
jgi:AbrB family looped-hinge helix DNA binding protein